MLRKLKCKHHRFPRQIMRCAVRCYMRYPLSYQDVVSDFSTLGTDLGV